jgi:hypothetical protein
VSGANGVPLKRVIDDRWEIVEAYGSRWIGRIDRTDDEVVTLSPAFVYISNPQIQPNPQGPPGSVNLGWQRIVLPLEMLASPARIKLRWSARYRIVDFDTADQAIFENAVAEALANQQKIAAARAGLTIVPQMPKLPAPPGGRSH